VGFFIAQKQFLTLLDFIAREIARGEAIYHKLTLMRGLSLPRNKWRGGV